MLMHQIHNRFPLIFPCHSFQLRGRGSSGTTKPQISTQKLTIETSPTRRTANKASTSRATFLYNFSYSSVFRRLKNEVIFSYSTNHSNTFNQLPPLQSNYSVKMILFCRDIDLVSQTSSRVTPAEKDGRKSEGQKASGNRRVYKLVTFILIMHIYDHLKEVERFVWEINGVESVKGDSTSNKLEVKGKVDPKKIRKMVKRKTKREVKLILPSAESEGCRDENKRPDEKWEEKTRPDDIANTKIEEGVTVLKIKLCCDSCNQKLKQVLKVKGLETLSMDKDKDLVKVKGTVNMTELKSSVKGVLRKEKDIEVVVPAKKDTAATEKKDTQTGVINGKDVGLTEKKGKEVGAAKTTIREKETELADKKSKGKGKGKNAGATDKKEKQLDTTDKDSEHKGNAGVRNKSENKDSGVNQKKDRRSGYRKNEETSSDGSRRGNSQPPPRYGYGGHMYGYLPHMVENSHQVVYMNQSGYPMDDSMHYNPMMHAPQMFSDENPNACFVM